MSTAEYVAQLEAQTERQSQLLDVALDTLTELGFDLFDLAEGAGIELELL